MRRINRSIQIVILLTLVFGFGSCLKDTPTSEKIYGGKVGQYLPGFELNDQQGNAFDQNDLVGKTVLIEFWASWCSYCSEEVDGLNKLYSNYKDKNVEVVGISIDTDPNAWKKKVSDHNIEYTQLIDTDGFNSEIAKACEVSNIPKMLLTDPEGKILLVTTKASEVNDYLVRNNY